MSNSLTLRKNWHAVLKRIDQAVQLAQRTPGSVRLVAVSKRQSNTAVRALYDLGQRAFGENYVQEAVDKMVQLSDLPDIEWHLIGPLQSNKAKQVAQHFAWIHSLDRLKLAQKLNEARLEALSPLFVCLQVNISQEATKSGIALTKVLALADAIATLPRLRVRGLMAIPDPQLAPQALQQQFHQLYQCYRQGQKRYPHWDTLSLGMSQDLETAVCEGSTLVRIGTALFGARI